MHESTTPLTTDGVGLHNHSLQYSGHNLIHQTSIEEQQQHYNQQAHQNSISRSIQQKKSPFTTHSKPSMDLTGGQTQFARDMNTSVNVDQYNQITQQYSSDHKLQETDIRQKKQHMSSHYSGNFRNNPATQRTGQLALMNMGSSSGSALVPVGANSSRGSYGGAHSLVPKRPPRFGGVASSGDNIQVRIRGKNNFLEHKTGSVTRTMDEVFEEKARRQEINKAANRLKMLEKLEVYREEKMHKEIAQLEEERKLEELELQKARDKEQKYNKYLKKQRERLAGHTKEKQIEDEKKQK